MKKFEPSKYLRRGRTLVLGLPDLQRTFDEMKEGGGLILDVSSEPQLGVDEILILDNQRLAELAHQLNFEDLDKSKLN